MPKFASKTARRREGFAGQMLVVVPVAVVNRALKLELLSALIPVAAGRFPDAQGHLVERSKPLDEGILILCTGGRGWVSTGGFKPVPVETDEALFIPPGIAHAYGAEDSQPWSIEWAHFRGSDVPAISRLMDVTRERPVIQLPAGACERLQLFEVCEILERDYVVSSLLLASARLRMVFAGINRLRSHADPILRMRDDSMERVIKWMRNHVDHRPELRSLAARAGLSIPHFSVLFRRKTGYPPVDYFLRLKVRRACALFDTTALRVEEVAALVGYSDAFYFSRLFRRVMGKSPRAYRATPKG